MSLGFEKVYLLQNPLNMDASEIISTYVYKVGLLGAQFSYSTAIGLFNTLCNLILLITVNTISAKVTEASLW
jgi:putative aldouronate transport system permease protein